MVANYYLGKGTRRNLCRSLKCHVKGDSEFSSRRDPGKDELGRLPWWAEIPVQRAWVRSLVREVGPTRRD